MKKIVLISIALALCIPVITFAADVTLTSDGKVPGTPFQNLQNQINQLNTNLNNIQLTPGPAGPAGPQGPAGSGITGISGMLSATIESDGSVLTKQGGTTFTVATQSPGIYSIQIADPILTYAPTCVVTPINTPVLPKLATICSIIPQELDLMNIVCGYPVVEQTFQMTFIFANTRFNLLCVY